DNLDVVLARQPRQYAQLFELGFDRQPVSALGFTSGGAAAQHLVETAARVRRQLFVGCCPRRRDGAQDTAALARDVRVRLPGQTKPELVPAIAGVDYV